MQAGDTGVAEALPDAAQWLAALMTGHVATMVAVLAVAAIGLLMLSGRLPVRRAGFIIIGCFVLFGAQGIASALLGVASGGRGLELTSPLPSPPVYRPSVPVPVPYDPYAGASVPQQTPAETPLR